MRAIADSDPKPSTEEFEVREALTSGDMIKTRTLEKLIENQLKQLNDKVGIIIDGFPRNTDQASYFQTRVRFINFHLQI